MDTSQNTFKKKLNLRTKLENLIESVDDSYIKNVVQEKLNDHESVISNPISVAMDIVEKLHSYTWMSPVNDFINHVTNTCNENKNLYYLQYTVEKLSNTLDESYYKNALHDIDKLLYLEESDVEAQIKRGILDEHKWINEVDGIIREATEYREETYSGQDQFTVEHHISPVKLKKDKEGNIKSTIFELEGSLFEMNSETRELNTVTGESVDTEFYHLVSLRDNLILKNESFFFYKGSNIIEIDPQEDGSNKIFVNDKELHEENLVPYLESSGIFNLNEVNSGVNFINYAFHNAHKLVELDFVDKIKPKAFEYARVNFINAGDDMWIQKIDERYNKNIVEKKGSAKETVNEIKNFIGYDVSDKLSEKLKSEKSKTAELREKKNDIEKRVSYIEEKLKETEDAINEGAESLEIYKAKKLLKEERDKLKNRLGDIKEELGLIEQNAGFIEGKILVELDDHNIQEGDTVEVNAEQYSSAGKSEKVEIMMDSGAKTSVKKRFLEVNI